MLLTLGLASYSISVSVKPVWIRARDCKPLTGDIGTIEIRRWRRYTKVWIWRITVTRTRTRYWIRLFRWANMV